MLVFRGKNDFQNQKKTKVEFFGSFGEHDSNAKKVMEFSFTLSFAEIFEMLKQIAAT